jgi:hypothetical protein
MSIRSSDAHCPLRFHPEVEVLEGRQLLSHSPLFAASPGHEPPSEFRTGHDAGPGEAHQPPPADDVQARAEAGHTGGQCPDIDSRPGHPDTRFWEQPGNTPQDAWGWQGTVPLPPYQDRVPVTPGVVLAFTLEHTSVDVPHLGATDVTGLIPAEAAALVLASMWQPAEADGVPREPALAVAPSASTRHLPVGGRRPAPAGTVSRNGLTSLSAANLGGTGRPAIATAKGVPRPAVAAGKLPPSEAKPAERKVPAFAAEAADLLTHALSVSLARFDQALLDLTGADADGHRSDLAVLYWFGLSSWVVSGALAYRMARRRARVTPVLGSGALLDEDDPFLEGLA